MNLGEVASYLDRRYPPSDAAQWDNVGLICGDPSWEVGGALVCVDVTPAVVEEARQAGAGLIIAHHPVIFPSVSRVTPGSAPAVWEALRLGVAVYAMHTNFDVAADGTNAVLADLLGLEGAAVLEPCPSKARRKVVVFTPPEDVEALAEAAFEAGGGGTGRYDRCSFRVAGQGTFRGLAGASPAVGEAGRYERVDEVRMELMADARDVSRVVEAIVRAHRYEEPVIDVLALEAGPSACGHGRAGTLASPMTVEGLLARIKEALSVRSVRVAGGGRVGEVTTVAVAAGAGRSLLSAARAAGADVMVTGEVGHHDAIDHADAMTIVCIGHGASERPAMARLAELLVRDLPGLGVALSRRDAEPFETR